MNFILKTAGLLWIGVNLILAPVLIAQNNEDVSKPIDSTSSQQVNILNQKKSNLVISKIIVRGNKYVKTEAILARLPYREGAVFETDKSGVAIQNLYDLGSFRQIQLDGEDVENNKMNLYVTVEEKKLVEKIDLKGNKSLKTKQIKEKLNLEKLPSIDEETMRRIALAIKKLYREENHHLVDISYELIPNQENPDKATALFTIDEGPRSLIKYVHFVGNHQMPDRKLRNILFTRENWLLSFMDSAGSYNDDMLEMDKHRIEYFYRDYGYLTAKVTKPKIEYSQNNKEISVTFFIKEGKQFCVRDIHVIGDEMYGEDELLPFVELQKDKPFSQSSLVTSMNRIKDLYGEKGYIYCDVYPQIKPDEQTNEVDVTFHIERGNRLYVNFITITGNKITRDKVIRRQFDIAEGDLITTRSLERSRMSVEYLSFFEKDGVKWKIHRLSDELADLELNVQEAKTGNLNFMLTYGTDQYNPTPSLRGMINVTKSNLLGRGWDVGALVQADRHQFRRVEAHFADQHLFDSNISGAFFFYTRWDEYDQWHSIDKKPKQRVTGGHAQFGFWLPRIDKRLQLVFDVGIENIKNNDPRAIGRFKEEFEPIVRRTFQEGTLQWFGLELVKDTRDHQVYPKNGYKICVGTRAALPGFNRQFSFIRGDMEASYYTPLIEKFILDDSLVLCLHGKLGNIQSISNNPIPYKELYHMGGQSTVRGFVWGGIGPAWVTGDPLGARNALQFNTELIFPLIPDYSMKAHLFYDAGAGWDTPKEDIPDTTKIKRDKFDFRHAVGFGLNLVRPVPAKIDWGFKLDRKKKENESPHEFHLSMNYAW